MTCTGTMLLEAGILPAKLLVVGRVRLYRDAISAALGRSPWFRVVGNCGLEAAEKICLGTIPDVVLLDAIHPAVLPLVRRLSQVPGVSIIVLAAGEDEDDVMQCIEAGVDGFLPATADADHLPDMVVAVLRGELCCTPRIAACLYQRLAKAVSYQPAVQRTHAIPLTIREREIAAHLSAGLSNKEIAQSLDIGVSTVKNHVHTILEKLQIGSRADVASRLVGLRRRASPVNNC
ncbi:LuxR C-terminal-related transcriptional regulator [Arenibaculum pallidiluteum]|uniref:LuxR C-terminal-related transcriptional regulator n=1 Tax=Arenibaculum pallidiluteum TaxID=2812559 RepID=UPI001A958B65|nr:response regulator transcription factor [Arenibaculum pallidiluteum]